MKQKLTSIAFLILTYSSLISQPVLNPVPATVPTQAAGAWYRGGNNLFTGNGNVLGFQTGANSQVWFATNGFYRMMMDDGSNAILDGRISMGNNLPGTFQPVDRLHLHQTGGTTAMRYSTNATGSTVVDGLQVGILGNGAAFMRNFEPSQPVLIGTHNGVTSTVDRIKVSPYSDNGFISMGTVNVFPAPLALLHLSLLGPNINMANTSARGEMFRTDGENTVTNAWRMFTSSPFGTTERFSVYVPALTTDAHLKSESGDMYFETALQAPALGTLERMRITSAPGNVASQPIPNATKVNINYGGGAPPITNPVATLNIGMNPAQTPNGGQRSWMDVGTFMCGGSDNMYVGLKNEMPNSNIITGSDRLDAVVNWGDNTQFPSPFGPDNLRFIFTSLQNPATTTGAASQEGLEGMRMTPVSATAINTGIGGDPSINQYGPLQNSINPTNTLEVNSPNATNVLGGSSGLRFTNLNATSPPTPNVANGNVLSVNGNGDVILVPGGTGVPFGGNCGNTNVMTNDFEIPMNNMNYIFSGQGVGTNSVGIGIPAGTCTPMPAKLTINQAAPGLNNIALLSRNSGTSSCAIMAINTGTGGTNTNPQVGGWFQTIADQYAVVVPKNGGFVSIGYATTVSSPSFSWNGTFTTQVPTAMVDVAGSIYMGGLLVNASDASLKQNVQAIPNALERVLTLEGVNFEWITVEDSTMSGMHGGFIAQQVDTVIPEVVHTNASGIMSVAYTELIPYLVEALKEEHRRNDSLSSKVDSLVQAVSSCCNSSRTVETSYTQTDVTLTNATSIVLNQNVPNPFAEQTVISYYLPESTVKAQMLFYDVNGKLIKAVDLEGRGHGQLNVFADDLSSGIYSYALVADGHIADSKTMVKSK
jgi:hypothetical protein